MKKFKIKMSDNNNCVIKGELFTVDRIPDRVFVCHRHVIGFFDSSNSIKQSSCYDISDYKTGGVLMNNNNNCMSYTKKLNKTIKFFVDAITDMPTENFNRLMAQLKSIDENYEKINEA